MALDRSSAPCTECPRPPPLSPQIDQLTKDWARKWNEWKALVEHYRVDINRRRAGLVIDSSLPHLMALEDDVLSTGVVLYHLKVSGRVHPPLSLSRWPQRSGREKPAASKKAAELPSGVPSGNWACQPTDVLFLYEYSRRLVIRTIIWCSAAATVSLTFVLYA